MQGSSPQPSQDALSSVANHYIFPVIKGFASKTTGIFRSIFCITGGGGGNEKMASTPKPTSPKIHPLFNRNTVRLAGLTGALAIALGAYGAHVIMTDPKIDDKRKQAFQTANLYHFIGTGGLVAASLGRFPKVTALLMTTGCLLFCGTLYYNSITGEEKTKRFAPIGGSTLILAWLTLIL